jgi:hypothetical protein
MYTHKSLYIKYGILGVKTEGKDIRVKFDGWVFADLFLKLR